MKGYCFVCKRDNVDFYPGGDHEYDDQICDECKHPKENDTKVE